MAGLGPGVVSVVGPTEVLLLDFLCTGIQLYKMLSPYLCFVSFYIFICMYKEMKNR